MQSGRFYFVVIFSLLALLGYLTYRIMSPFFTAIGWSVVITIVFFPVYVFISKYVKVKALSSLITLILILGLLIGPFMCLTSILIDELQSAASQISQNKLDTIENLINRVKASAFVEKVGTYLGIEELVSEENIKENFKRIGKGLIEDFSARIPNIIAGVLDFVLMMLATFFLLKDGPGFISRVRDYLPFSESQKSRLAAQIKDMIVSTVYGGVLIAIIQGALGGIAYYFIGIQSPVMWGVAMSIMSFVPLLGTFAIWGPTAAYLVIEGDYTNGIVLFLYGVLVISMVDNILKPVIIGSRTKMPTIIILFSVLGGIKLFGIIGLIMGPLITAIFISVFEIFSKIEGGVNAYEGGNKETGENKG